jgi:hypothetical protein
MKYRDLILLAFFPHQVSVYKIHYMSTVKPTYGVDESVELKYMRALVYVMNGDDNSYIAFARV